MFHFEPEAAATRCIDIVLGTPLLSVATLYDYI